MSVDFVTKVAIVLMIVLGSAFLWMSTEGPAGLEDQVMESVSTFVPFDIRETLTISGFDEDVYCPFLNPYTAELFSAGSLEVPVERPIHAAFEYVIRKELGRSSFDCESSISANYDYETDLYAVSCIGSDSVDVSTPQFSYLLNEYAKEENHPTVQTKAIKSWQCLLFFGIFPFFSLFMFMRDILGFTLLSRPLKLLIASFASLLALVSGMFTEFIWQLAYMSSLSVQGTLLIVLLFMGFFSVILSWIGTISAAVGEAGEQAAELQAGLAEKGAWQAFLSALQSDER